MNVRYTVQGGFVFGTGVGLAAAPASVLLVDNDYSEINNIARDYWLSDSAFFGNGYKRALAIVRHPKR